MLEDKQWSWVLLITSSTTLICCALPILLVSMSLGAVSAAMFANFPFLTILAHYKIWLFAGSGVMMVAAGWALFRPNRTCPADSVKAKACAQAHRWNTRIFSVSLGIWLIGFAAAYLALPLLTLYDNFIG
ncbi:MAG: hypothetical protein JKX88_01560 [Marinicaulis sp.]|nr:hypothetical protein [Marinicaulis sp.]